MRTILTPLQRKKLKEHVYRSEGIGIIEALVLKKFWAWLVLKFPLWLAPNLMTMIGFIVTLVGALCVILQDLNCEGKAPSWSYVLCAVGILIYQTLDGMDGMQARRTGTNNPLGEFFDHGLDAIATFLYAIAAACIPGLVEYPYFMFSLVSAMILLNYTYHWQTYVSGVLYFKHVDVCEAHIAQVVTLLLTYFLGKQVWHHQTLSFLGIFYPLKVTIAVGTLFFSVLNFLSAIYIILTKGVGKNGSTVADTSVISPIITPVIIVGVASLYGFYSPAHLLQTHSVLFLTAFLLPFSKAAVLMMLAAMTKTPFPLLDPSMFGPVIASFNLYFGTPVPEFYLISAVAVYNVFDVTLMLYTLCREFCDTLGVACFTIPYNRSKDKVQSASSNSDTG